MTSLKHFFQLIRWQNLAIIVLTLTLLRYWSLSNPVLTTIEFVVFVLGMLLIAAAGNIVNDIFDLKIDLINKPQKVIIQQHISTSTAWKIYFGFNLLAILLGVYLANLHLLALFIVAIVLLFFYSKILKKKALIGNVLIALLCAWVVVAFWMVEQERLSAYWQTILWSYVAFAFFTTLSRELIKDMEDIRGDRRGGCKTFPILYGENKTKIIVYLAHVFLLLILFLESLFFCNEQKNLALFYTFFGLILGLFLLSYNTFLAKKSKDYKRLSQEMKFYMLLGLGLLLLV